MDTFNRAVTRIFDGLLSPVASLHPLWGIGLVSILTAAAMLWIYGKVSNQDRIRFLKGKVKGHILEIWIFRESLRVVIRAQLRAFGYATRYALCALPAFVILAIPVVVIMVQLDARYGRAPLDPGQSAIVKAHYADTLPLEAMDVRVETPAGVTVETPPLRMPGAREVDYRIRASEPGRHEIVFRTRSITQSKTLCVGTKGTAVSPLRSARWLDRFFHPAEPGLPDGPLAKVEIVYPRARISLWGMRFHWLWPFFILSIAAAFLLKRPLKIEV